jgi:hypothetical protein
MLFLRCIERQIAMYDDRCSLLGCTDTLKWYCILLVYSQVIMNIVFSICFSCYRRKILSGSCSVIPISHMDYWMGLEKMENDFDLLRICEHKVDLSLVVRVDD